MENSIPKWAYLLGGGVILLVVILIVNPFVIVSAGERGVVLTWGAVSNDVLTEGIHFRTPIAQKVRKINVQIQKEQVTASAASKDLQIVTSSVALNYHLDPVNVHLLWKNIGSEYKERIIDPAIQEAVKGATAQYTADQLITNRSEVKEKIKLALFERLSHEYIIVDEFSVVDFNFSESFNDAIEMKVTAEQSALAAKNKLEQSKYEAEQRIAQARGEAEAIKIQAQAVNSQGGADYVQLQAIKAWDGKLPTQMIPNATVPFLNLK